jgi:phosphoenolpyruvate phosphomutase
VSSRTSNTSQGSPSRAKRLRELLLSNRVTVLMEAHSGLSAKLAAEAGFEALWGSGLAISAALGVRDNNEASWTQVLEVLEFMADATELPILLDGDTGYGNFNNVRRLVRKLEQRNIAGVCLEDKLFPKTNSFIDGERQALAEVDEFCGKLNAAKDTQRDPDFVVVARTEAFIAGWGLEETVLRATAYAEAGADLILVHSKRKDSKEIMAFMQRWDQRVPVVIVPTKYPTEPIDSFVRAGITNFIFANHAVRTVVTALQRNLGILRSTLDLMSIENDIAPVSEVFRLQNVQELKSSEERYLPSSGSRQEVSGLVLAASKGDFGELVKDRPKAMLRLRGKPIMTWHTDAFRRQGIRRIGAVRGYCKQAIDLADIQYFDNDEYATTGELASLYAARDFLRGDVVISYGDIVFDEFILRNLLSQGGEISIAVDGGWKLRGRTDEKRDLVVTDGAYDPMGLSTCKLVRMGEVKPVDATGEWIGLLHLRAEKTEKLVKLLDHFAKEEPETLRTGDIPGLLNRLVGAGETVSVVHTFGHWYDLDEQKDLLLASAQVKS